jgi:hypothetical protein
VSELFPYANIVVGILVLIVGFLFHWVGQLVSLVNWNFATRLGIQEAGLPDEYKVYEHAIAVADTAIGWVYGIAGVGLILGAPWGYKLAWIPGSVLLYHGICFWFWIGNQRKQAQRLTGDAIRIGWFLANIITAGLTLAVAWYGNP